MQMLTLSYTYKSILLKKEIFLIKFTVKRTNFLFYFFLSLYFFYFN